MSDVFVPRHHLGRNITKILGKECSVNALSWALDETNNRVYAGMSRDMSVPLSTLGVASYTPGEICTYLFENEYRFLHVDFMTTPFAPHVWGIPTFHQLNHWIKDSCAVLALALGEWGKLTGHWVGYDGTHFNNTKVLGFANDVVLRQEFLDRCGMSPDWIGVCPDGRSVHLQQAILIER